MKIWIAAFTDEGICLGTLLAKGLGEDCKLYTPKNLSEWTKNAFEQVEGIIFIGACGIAVRAIAPYLKGKAYDPAVVVVDQKGNFAISLLSGHIGGANILAERVACLCGAQPIITTATDLCGVFAVDTWAIRQNLIILDIDLIKKVSGALLAKKPVGFISDFQIDKLPVKFAKNALIGISISTDSEKKPFPITLRLTPRIGYLGIGCRKNTLPEILEAAVFSLLKKMKFSIEALAAVCTIDLKANEPALSIFCEKYKLPLLTFSVEILKAQKGEFTSSDFVSRVTGVDNVCERAAIAGSVDGKLLCNKTARNGVTTALAVKKWENR